MLDEVCLPKELLVDVHPLGQRLLDLVQDAIQFLCQLQSVRGRLLLNRDDDTVLGNRLPVWAAHGGRARPALDGCANLHNAKKARSPVVNIVIKGLDPQEMVIDGESES